MLMCFIDESGTPAKLGAASPRYFVIAGVILPEERWHRVSDQLKTRWAYRGELKWRYFSPSNNDPNNPMAQWEQARRNEFRADAFRIVTSDQSLKVVAGVCDAPLAYKLPNVRDQNLVEGLFLAPSHLSVGLQLADLVAGAIWRRFDTEDRRWFDLIRANLRTNSAGRIDGYGIARYPKQGWTGPIED